MAELRFEFAGRVFFDGPEHELAMPFGPVSEVKGLVLPMANQKFTLTDIQSTVVGPITAVDKRGNPCPLAGPLVWSVSDETVLHVTDNGDATATLGAVGPLGTAQITVTDGVGTQIGDIEVIASAEAGLSMPFAPATDPSDALSAP